MSLYKTKSKNIHLYKEFFLYDAPANIPFRELGKKLGKTPNALRGMIRSAKRNFTIYLAYRRMGYPDNKIPSWFKRPPKHIAEIVELEITAIQRSSTPDRSQTAESLSAQRPQRHETPPKAADIPRETAQPSAALSAPSVRAIPDPRTAISPMEKNIRFLQTIKHAITPP